MQSEVNERAVLLLMAGQSFFFGIALAMVYIVGNTIFLDRFGAARVPIVYIALGLVAALLFFGLAALQRRWAIGPLSILVFGLLGLVYLLAAIALRWPGWEWLSGVLMIMLPLGQQTWGVLVGGQVGYLFDVRQMKRLFPLVFTSIASGFILGSLSAPWLLSALPDLPALLLLSTGCTALAILFTVLAMQTFPAQLRQRPAPPSRGATKSLWSLLQDRYTATLFSYQMLSAVGTQLVVYIFLTQAERQFPDPTALATFFGAFAGWRNVISLAFIFLIAGRLLSRFGLRLGLMLNPAIVVAFVALMLGLAVAAPGALPAFFGLALLAYVLDNLLSDGITNTSIKTTYQVLPVADRATVETVVEGVGVPAAFTIAGLCLLAFNAIPGLTLAPILAFTLAICLLWTGAALLAYRGYAAALVQRLQRRTLWHADITLDDPATLAVVHRFLHDDDLPRARLALDLLARDNHPSLAPHLLVLLDSPDEARQRLALERLAAHPLPAARPAVEARIHAATPAPVRAAAIQALCALAEGEAVAQVTPALTDPAPEVRESALVGLLRHGGILGTLAAGERLLAQAAAPEAADRIAAARAIGAVGERGLAPLLRPLLTDTAPEVRRAALAAAGRVRHPGLFPLMLDQLEHPAARSAALAALVACGEAVLDTVAATLPRTGEPASAARLIRLLAQIDAPRATTLLRQQLLDGPPTLRPALLAALHRHGYRATGADQQAVERLVLAAVADGTRRLLARQEIGAAPEAAMLHRALLEESQAGQRLIFGLLALRYDARAMLQAESQLRQRDARRRALALEMLEVNLPPSLRALVLPLVDESLPLDQRIATLQAPLGLTSLERTARLREIIMDQRTWPESWTRACAIHAAARWQIVTLKSAIRERLTDAAPIVCETAGWALDLLAPSPRESE